MDAEIIIDLFKSSLFTAILMVATIVLPGLFIGLIVSVFQAATQINEQTLSFIPRLLITMLTLIVFGPWLLKQLVSFSSSLINNIGFYIG